MKPKRDPRNKGKKSSSAKKKDRDPGRKPDGDHTGPRSRVSRFPTAKKHLLCPIFEGHYEFSCALNALEISDGKFHVGDDSDRTHDAIKQELVTLLVFALDKVLTIDQDTHDCVQELVDRFYTKKLDDSHWEEWQRADFKQLDAHFDSGTIGKAVPRPTLQPGVPPQIYRGVWARLVKPSGIRKSRLCLDGSKRAAPWLRMMVSTYSSCVEMPCV